MRHCMILPHLLSTRFNPHSLVLPLNASPLCLPCAKVCQKNVPSSGGGEREKRGFVLLCWMGKCSLMKGATSPAAHSQPSGALPSVGCEGLQASRACPRANHDVPAFWETYSSSASSADL